MFEENQAETTPTTDGKLKYHYDRESAEVQLTEMLLPPTLILLGLFAAALLVGTGLMS